MTKIDQYAVMGNPIQHSKSPLIHQRFAQQTQQELAYEAILAAKDNFRQSVNKFIEQSGKGLNVTVPFKEEAWQIAHQRTSRAESAGAVNTLKFENQQIIADNTDGIGLVRDLTKNQTLLLAHKRLLILGAGGAVRGVLQPLLEEEPENITIANRTESKAHDLVTRFNPNGHINLHACGFSNIPRQKYDLIINATAASLKGNIPAIAVSLFNDTYCYDMMYGAQAKPFLQWAEQQGATHCADGLGMLVEQAAESFFFWRGTRPQTGPVIAELKRT